MNEFYVYIHRDTNDLVRYIGLGKGPRKFKLSSGRSKEWYACLSDGVTYQIIMENLSKEDAESLKVSLMEIYKDTIINKRLPNKPLHISREYFSKYFSVDSESPTGLILKESSKNFKAIGKPCGYIKSPNGKEYWSVSKNGVEYLVHRIVYTLHHGEFDPSLVVNHIDGNGLNNSIENLELTTIRLNSLKCKDSKNSTTGYNGVVLHKGPDGAIGGACAKYPTDAFKMKSKFFSLAKYKTIENCIEAASQFHTEMKNKLIQDLIADKKVTE